MRTKGRIFYILTKKIAPHNREYLGFIKNFGISKIGQLKDPYYFIHLPKCAGNSVQEYLVKNNIPTIRLGHNTRSKSYKFPSEISRENNSKAFCVVRNPFDRLISAYFFLKKGGIKIEDAEDFKEYLSEYKDFNDFVVRGLGNKDSRKKLLTQIHLKPLVEFVKTSSGNLCLAKENVLKLEKINSDFINYVQSRGIHKSGNLPTKNKNNKRGEYKKMYQKSNGSLNKKIIAIVVDTYREDFETFGYSKKLV